MNICTLVSAKIHQLEIF